MLEVELTQPSMHGLCLLFKESLKPLRFTDMLPCPCRPPPRNTAQHMAQPMKKKRMRMTSAWRLQLTEKPSDPQMPSTMITFLHLRSVDSHFAFTSNLVPSVTPTVWLFPYSSLFRDPILSMPFMRLHQVSLYVKPFPFICCCCNTI